MSEFSQIKAAKFLNFLSKEEYLSFGKWLASPWCNSNKKLSVLHKILLPYHPRFDSKRLNKERLFQKLYPTKQYDDKWMRNILAAMTKQVEKFMVHQRLENNDVERKRMLADEFLERHDLLNYQKIIENVVEIIQAKRIKGTEEHLNLFRFHAQHYAVPESVKNEEEHRAVLLAAEYHLDAFYTIQKWRYRIVKAERERLLQGEHYGLTEDAHLDYLTEKQNLPIPLLYRKLYGARWDDFDADHFYEVKQIVKDAFNDMPLVDKNVHLSFLLNLAIKFWLGGNRDMMKEMFSLLDYGVEEDVYLFHGKLPERIYANYVTVGNSVGKYEKVMNFVEKHTDSLRLDLQSDGKSWAMAHGAFRRGDYLPCIEFLSQQPFRAHTFNMQSKILLLQTYFLLTEKDDSFYFPFLDLGHALEKFLKRDKVLTISQKKSCLNFISKSRKLFNYKYSGNSELNALGKIRNEIEEEKNIQARTWLIEQLEKQL